MKLRALPQESPPPGGANRGSTSEKSIEKTLILGGPS
jgi:hypothetical protein